MSVITVYMEVAKRSIDISTLAPAIEEFVECSIYAIKMHFTL